MENIVKNTYIAYKRKSSVVIGKITNRKTFKEKHFRKKNRKNETNRIFLPKVL